MITMAMIGKVLRKRQRDQKVGAKDGERGSVPGVKMA
jgi:hypothetical protein